jgi:hypothetical protein
MKRIERFNRRISGYGWHNIRFGVRETAWSASRTPRRRYW